MGLEAALWRAVAVYRFASLAYAAVLIVRNSGGYEHPLGGWAVLAVMVVWTFVATYLFADPRWRGWPLLIADLAVCLGCMMATPWVESAANIGAGRATLTASWVAAAVLSWAVAGGKRYGITAAVVLGAGNILVHVVAGTLEQLQTPGYSTFNGIVLLGLAGLAGGHVVKLAMQAEARLARAVELEAATRERERLARRIHDSTLQVLAMVHRRGGEIGGEAAELGRMAGEQEAALRTLISSTGISSSTGTGGSAGIGDGTGAAPGSAASAPNRRDDRAAPHAEVDLRPLLDGHASPLVTVSTPATPVRLPGHAAGEVEAAVAAALGNVRAHCGDGTRTWVLVEDDGAGEITVSVRDDGPGMARGRLAEAVASGRLGVAQSIQGRIRDLGGTVSIVSAPGQGTEIEMTVPARRAR
ncbi:MacS family sensor histidine kinase [Actinomadura sp. 9N407]|uniref:MacS family sensor histidine kinase n=1 Tax=Actinomadura sp. 9N407 TaxID=3375154 RepID=UPI0037BA2002